MYINIPVELCEYAIRNKFYRPMQLYIYLKTHCSGMIKIPNKDLLRIAKAIRLTSAKAVKNNLKILLGKNWIGYDEKSKYYFIRGFERIRQLHGLRAKTAAEFDSREIRKLKAFMAAAKIGYLLNKQKRGRRAAERKYGRSHPTARQSSYFPLSNETFAKMLNISKSTAYTLKYIAYHAGYIDVIKTFEDTNFSAYELNLFEQANPDMKGRAKIRDGKIVLQGTDLIEHYLLFRKRKKLEP